VYGSCEYVLRLKIQLGESLSGYTTTPAGVSSQHGASFANAVVEIQTATNTAPGA
jgi:7,8-dihydro-6-hydroxymethylpterin-pyrophosphokinase